MAVFEYEKDGIKLFGARFKARSKVDRTVTVQLERTGFKTEAEARKVEKQLTTEANREVARREMAGVTLEELLHDWEMKAKAGLVGTRPVQLTTIIDSVQSVRLFLEDHLPRPAQHMNRIDVLEALRQMESDGYSHSRKRSVLSALNKIFQWGIDARLLPASTVIPSKGITLDRKERKKPLILNEREIKLLLERARELGHDWYPVWAFAVLTGCRSGELQTLEWKDLDWDRRVITISKSWNGRLKVVKSTKGGYWRDVPINEDLERLLRDLHAKTGNTPYVLPRLHYWKRGEQSKPIKAFCREIGIPEITFHTLRACFATHLLQRRVSPTVVQKIAGWTEMKTMQRYVRLAGVEIQGATDALRLLPEEIPTDRVVSLRKEAEGG